MSACSTVMLPELDGWKLIETARAEGIGTPIVVVSARGTEHDRVHALEIGADDYLVKPFSMRELVARVGAAADVACDRRRNGAARQSRSRSCAIDPREVQAFVDGKSAELTPTEFKLLYTLALDRGAWSPATSSSKRSGDGGRPIATERSTSSCGVCGRRSIATHRSTRSSRRASASVTSSSLSSRQPSSSRGLGERAGRDGSVGTSTSCQRTIFPVLDLEQRCGLVARPLAAMLGRSVSVNTASTWPLLRGSSSVIVPPHGRPAFQRTASEWVASVCTSPWITRAPSANSVPAASLSFRSSARSTRERPARVTSSRSFRGRRTR